MSTQGFSTSHSHPFSLEEAILLDINTLIQEVSRLRNSIAYLQKTQVELRSYLEEDPEDEDGEIGLAIKENDETIASQTERIDLIRVALTSKVGEEGLKHYGSGLGFDAEEKGPGPTKNTVEGTRTETGLPSTEDARGATNARTETSEEGLHL